MFFNRNKLSKTLFISLFSSVLYAGILKEYSYDVLLGTHHSAIDEIVYYDSGVEEKLSELNWRVNHLPIISYDMKGVFKNDVALKLSLKSSMPSQSFYKGRNQMDDYDFMLGELILDDQFTIEDLEDLKANYPWTNWSSHSVDVKDYFEADLMFSKSFYKTKAFSFDAVVGIGIYKTNLVANDGLAIYWDEELYIYQGMYLLQFDMFAPESRDAVISYKVVVPRQYFGLVTHFDTKSCFFKLTALGGKTFNSYDVDNHILRDLIFKENINSSMFYRLALESKVPLNSHLSWVSRLDYQGVINARADTTLYNSWDEEEPDFYPDGAGIRLRSFNAFLGAEIKF